MLLAEGGPDVGVVAVCCEVPLEEVNPMRADLLKPRTRNKSVQKLFEASQIKFSHKKNFPTKKSK